jgi:hypothetical protein
MMPTQDQLQRLVAEFEREFPESLIDRLNWWARVLGINRIRLSRLLGRDSNSTAFQPPSPRSSRVPGLNLTVQASGIRPKFDLDNAQAEFQAFHIMALPREKSLTFSIKKSPSSSHSAGGPLFQRFPAQPIALDLGPMMT